MTEETVQNNTVTVQTSVSGKLKETSTENPDDVDGNSTSSVSIRNKLTRKAARFFDESDYSEKEYASLLDMYDQTMKSFELGNIVDGKILKVTEDSVIVDIGFKSEGIISLHEFGSQDNIVIGDTIEVFLDDFENQDGQMVLSKQKADFMRVWDKIKDIYDGNEVVEGRMVRRIKGGIVVNLLGVDAFLPGSQIDIRQVRDFDQYIGKVAPVKIIKLNKTRRNIVVSRRAVLEEQRAKMRETVLAQLEIDQSREGYVKNITDFGAFIDLGGVDGLLHITDMSWGRINHPSELVSIGDRIDVKVLNFEEGKTRISLGMKQLTPYPWDGVDERYPEGSVATGKIVSTTDYGLFVELEHGIEGLIHISEMSWTQLPKHPSKIFKLGDEVTCKVLNVDKEEEKISLGIKQLKPNPWTTIDERHPIGSRVDGKVRNLTNFGAFVEIEDGIDGLVHISDMSWTKRIKHPSEVMKKGQTVEVVILDVNKESRRISLGHKQIFDDPWETLGDRSPVDMISKGTIIRILDRGVVVALENDIEGFVPAFQLGEDLKKPADLFNVNDELPLKVVEFDKDQRKIILSVREYFKDKDKAELEEFRKKYAPKPVTIGEAVGTVIEKSTKDMVSSSESPDKAVVSEVSGDDEKKEPPVDSDTHEEEEVKTSASTGEEVKSLAEEPVSEEKAMPETAEVEGTLHEDEEKASEDDASSLQVEEKEEEAKESDPAGENAERESETSSSESSEEKKVDSLEIPEKEDTTLSGDPGENTHMTEPEKKSSEL